MHYVLDLDIFHKVRKLIFSRFDKLLEEMIGEVSFDCTGNPSEENDEM